MTEKLSSPVEALAINKEHAEATVNNAVAFLKTVSEKLLNTDLDGDYCAKCKRSGPSAESLGKTFSYVAKTVDEIARLMEFSQGRADSRPDNGFGELVKLLTGEQFDQLQVWIKTARGGGL